MKKIILGMCAFLLTQSSLFCDVKQMIVNMPVVDLRSKANAAPQGLQGPALSKDIGDEDSQCLFCEPVLAEEINDAPGWHKVSVLSQKAWKDNKWVGYPGFIQSYKLLEVKKFPNYNIVLRNLWTPMFSEMDLTSKVVMPLAIGTMLEAKRINAEWWSVIVDGEINGYLKECDLVYKNSYGEYKGFVKANGLIYEFSKEVKENELELREKIVQSALFFVNVGASYVWGGRSPVNAFLKNQITGVDCSGFTDLCYKACALAIPRDSGPQRRACYAVESGKDLKKADLIFFARDEQGLRVNHVMMYVGNGQVIESTGLGFSSVHDLENPELNKDNIKINDLGARQISVKELIGVDIDEIESGKTIAKNGKYVFLGTFFGPDGNLDKINRMRLIALGQENTAW